MRCWLNFPSGFDGYPNPRQPCGDSKHDKVNIANNGT